MRRLLLATALLSGCAHHRLRLAAPDARVDPTGEVGPHDDAQTEWWHVHADLRDVQTGEELHVFAGFVVERTDLDRVAGLPVRFAVNPFHAAYVRVVDGERAWTADRHNFPDLLSARFADSGAELDLRHGDWRIAWELGSIDLRVSAGPHTLDLRLVPTEPPVLPGAGGRVELEPGAPHLWSQDERMKVEGQWREGREVRWVEGTAFHKHQWGRIYSPELDGFEWISLDLPGGGGLSVAWLHQDGMRGVAGSLAWVSRPDGPPIPLPVSQVRLTPIATWKSRRSGAEWPVAWHLEGPGLDLTVTARDEDQEIWAFPAPIYAGPAWARGTAFGAELDQVAFVEQAGEAVPPLRFLLASPSPPATPSAFADLAATEAP